MQRDCAILGFRGHSDGRVARAAGLQRYGCSVIHQWLKFFGSAVPPFSRLSHKLGRTLLKMSLIHLATLRAELLDHPVYAEVASVDDLRRFMEDHVFAVWDFMSLLKRLQHDMTCIRVPWFPADNARAARLINDIVIGEETDVGPDGAYVSHLDLYLRAMADVGASTHQFDGFRSLARAGLPVEAAMAQTSVPPHVQAFVAHTMALANSGATEEVLAAFFYGREDIIPEMFRRLLKTLPGARHDSDALRHFVYYIDRHIELDGDSHGPKGRELLEDLVADSPQRNEQALRAACNSINARIQLWNGTLSKLRGMRGSTASDFATKERKMNDGLMDRFWCR
jgi:Protein of unknown function (DUF3050)